MIIRNFIVCSVIGLFLFSPIHLSPVFSNFKLDPDNLPTIPADFCVLTPNLGRQGSIKFVEECENLDIFSLLPIPGPSNQKYGTHPMVCCPNLAPTAICFPTDEYCPTYVKPTTPASKEEETTELLDPDLEGLEVIIDPVINITSNIPKVSDENCTSYETLLGFPLNSTKCVNLKDCPGIFKTPFNTLPNKNPAYAGFCGWDKEDNVAKICCPGAEIQDQSQRQVVEPRFPGYPCHDKVNQCRHWKNNNGCRTDMDFVIDQDDPDNGRANSGIMFDFMMGTCMETCQHCGDKGCRDEHPDCVDWARQGYCIISPLFLTHTCRESCGVCGFLSADDSKEQIVGESTYSDFTDSRFDCGRYKHLTEINPKIKKEEEKLSEIKSKEEDNIEEYDYDVRIDREKRQNSEDDDADVFFSIEVGTPDTGLNFCGATLISDSWILTASHCYDDFGSSVGSARQVKINTIRDNTPYKEVIAIKRIYKHPKYVYPNLYNDIALLELGRRVEYSWDKYGDSPMCIDQDGENVGKLATIQGYGKTEKGYVSKKLLEANITVISNDQCKRSLASNTTGKPSIKAKIEKGLPKGLNDQMFCAQGTENKEGIIRGACEGDSGGPLFVRKDDGRQMLVGIVSGGIGCGDGYPGWYTKVAFFTPWIKCIIENSKTYKNNKAKIEKECNVVADRAEEGSPDDYIFDLRGTDDNLNTLYDYDNYDNLDYVNKG